MRCAVSLQAFITTKDSLLLFVVTVTLCCRFTLISCYFHQYDCFMSKENIRRNTRKLHLSTPSRPTASLFGLQHRISIGMFSNVSVTWKFRTLVISKMKFQIVIYNDRTLRNKKKLQITNV